MSRKNLKLYLWGAAFVSVFALSHAPPPARALAVFDGGRGAGALLTAPGLPAVPPSWVFRYAWLLAAALCFAPAAAPLGRGALRFVALGRRELGDWWVAGILSVAAAATAASFAYFSLGREGHAWEERELAFQARIFAAGRLTAPAPATDEYVTATGGGAGNFVVGPNEGVRDGRWFTVFMPAWPLLLAVGAALGRPWLVNPIVGLLTAFALFGYGRRLFGADAALVGVFLYALSPFAAFNNASAFAEPTFLLFLVLFLWAFDVGRETGRPRAYALAGALLVVAFAVRDYAALAALPAVAVLFYDVARKRTSGYALSYFILGVALAAGPLLYYNYATSGAAFTFPRSHALHTRFGVSPYLIYFTTRRLWVLATDFLGWPLLSF
ncbi:MAG TPA: glycosyltransferase family 39 protein, partial [bacterium]|nr:glycosyltransferase family 39 protein [bacterium]